jgi:hypothetical protein
VRVRGPVFIVGDEQATITSFMRRVHLLSEAAFTATRH